MTVWPYLLCGAGLLALRNWQAALAFALCVVLVRVSLPLGHLAFFAIYSCIGALAFFLWDKVAGVALCLVALLIVAHLIGWVGYAPKTIAAEVVLVIGMAASAYSGPSGGILARPSALYGSGPDYPFIRPSRVRAPRSAGDKAP